MSVAALVGSHVQGGADRDLAGPGLGLRAGYSFGSGLFLGLEGNVHTPLRSGDAVFGALLLELGYGLPLGTSELRPYLGLGALAVGSSNAGSLCNVATGECTSVRRDGGYALIAALGAALLHPLGEGFHAGADLRVSGLPYIDYGGVDDGINRSRAAVAIGFGAYALAGVSF